VINSAKCDGCSDCIKACPESVLELVTQFIDLEDKLVSAVKEEKRKKIKYVCSSCKPETKTTPCVKSCSKEAIIAIWNPK